MKKILLILIIIGFSISSKAQYIYSNGKATAKMDTLIANGNAFIFQNKTRTSTFYFRTSGDSCFIGDVNGERYIGTGSGGFTSGPFLKAPGVPYANYAEAPDKGLFTNSLLNFGIANSSGDSTTFPLSGGINIYKTGQLRFNINEYGHILIDDGHNSVAVGLNALVNNTSGSGNTAIGVGALNTNTTGSSNVAIGIDALNSNEGGYDNVAVGQFSLNTSVSGFSNVAVGSTSMMYLETGNDNTALGFGALTYNMNGNKNIAIGATAGGYSQLSNRLFINSISRTNIGGDTTKSIIYGYQDNTVANQRLYLNACIAVMNNLTAFDQ